VSTGRTDDARTSRRGEQTTSIATFLAGGAAISTLTAQVGARIVVLDVGVASPIPPVDRVQDGASLRSCRVCEASADLTAGLR